MAVAQGVVQTHMVHGKVMDQDVEARAEGKKVVTVDEGEGGEVNEDRVAFVALDEGRETVGEKDEGAKREDHGQMGETVDVVDDNHTVVAVAY